MKRALKFMGIKEAYDTGSMSELAVLILSMKFMAHIGHNLTKGTTFIQDHEFLGELYDCYDLTYDSVIERIIGTLGDSVDLAKIHADAAASLQNINTPFKEIMDKEKSLCMMIDSLLEGASEGTKNYLGNLADQSESRQYKIGQILK